MPSHSLIDRGIPPQAIALGAFQRLNETDQQVFAVIGDWINTSVIRLSLADCEKDFAKFAAEQNHTFNNTKPVFEDLFALEGIRTGLNWSYSSLLQYLHDELAEAEKESEAVRKIEDTRVNLLEFFSKTKHAFQQTLKSQRIYDGLLPNFKGCSSLVEFRPVYDSGRREIETGIIAATLSLEMMSPVGDEKEEIVSLQLDSDDITALVNELETLQGKLKSMQNLMSTKINLVNPTKSLPN